MPTYNAERYISEAIDSILAQTEGDFEFLIVDDGSTDGTIEIVGDYSDKRIRLVYGPRRGLSAALNLGLSIAQGIYVARMDADDISLPTRFARQVEYLDTHSEIGLVGTFAKMVYEGSDKPSELFCGGTKRFEFPGLLDAVKDTVACHPTIMFRKELFAHYNLRYNEKFSTTEDQELFSRALRVTRFHNICEPLLIYRIHGNNASDTQRADGLKNLLAIKKDILYWLHPTGCYRSEQQISDKINRIIEILDEPELKCTILKTKYNPRSRTSALKKLRGRIKSFCRMP